MRSLGRKHEVGRGPPDMETRLFLEPRPPAAGPSAGCALCPRGLWEAAAVFRATLSPPPSPALRCLPTQAFPGKAAQTSHLCSPSGRASRQTWSPRLPLPGIYSWPGKGSPVLKEHAEGWHSLPGVSVAALEEEGWIDPCAPLTACG